MSTNEVKNDIIESQLKAVDEMFSIKYITGENAKFSRTEGGFLSMSFMGEHYQRVQPYRAFPFTDPDIYISIRTGSGNDSKEIGMIEALSQLDEEARTMIREQLELRYFMPEIIKIHSVREEYGYSYWDVTTDRGECRFTTSMGGGTAASLSEIRLIIRDVDDNRFEIKDINKLTASELKMLDLYL